MKEIQKNLIELIKTNKSVKEIERILKISDKELLKQLNELKLLGYEYKKNIYSSGKMFLIPNQNVVDPFIFNIRGSYFRCLVLSDTHFGRKNDDFKLIDTITNYALKENIHIIYNMGDFIHNVYTNDNDLLYNSAEEQLLYVLDRYPFDKSIVNFILYGNHDEYSLIYDNFDVSSFVENRRLDMVSLGYNKYEQPFKRDFVFWGHKITEKDTLKKENSSIFISGHSHKMRIKYEPVIFISVPTASNLSISHYELTPLKGFLDLEFLFNDENYIKEVNMKMITEDLHLACENLIRLR